MKALRVFSFISVLLWATSSIADGPARVGNAYYEDLFRNVTCPSAYCYYTSAVPTPTDAYVRITHVACLLAATQGSSNALESASIQIRDGANFGSSNLLKQMVVEVPQPLVVGTTFFYTIDRPTLFVVGAGRYIFFVVNNPPGSNPPNPFQSSCGISGDLVPPQ